MTATPLSLTITLNNGTVTTSPSSLDVNEGDKITITIVRPNNEAINCALLFKENSPFTETFNKSLAAGTASFPAETVSTSAALGNDDYDIVLSESTIYLEDPTIIVSR